MGRHRESGKTSIFTIIVLIALIVAGWIYVPKFMREKAYIESLNTCRQLYTAKKWQAAIDAYKKLWADFPERGQVEKGRICDAYCHLATETYNSAITTKARQGYREAISLYEAARPYGALDGISLFNLADSYLETGSRGKAEEIFAEVKGRTDIDARRFGVLIKQASRRAGGH